MCIVQQQSTDKNSLGFVAGLHLEALGLIRLGLELVAELALGLGLFQACLHDLAPPVRLLDSLLRLDELQPAPQDSSAIWHPQEDDSLAVADELAIWSRRP